LQHARRLIDDVTFGDAAEADASAFGDRDGVLRAIELDFTVIDELLTLFDLRGVRDVRHLFGGIAELPKIAHRLKREIEGAFGDGAGPDALRHARERIRTDVDRLAGVVVDRA